MDPADDKFTKLIQEMDDFKNKFSPNPDARLSTGNGPHQDHLQVPSPGAAEAIITDSPILTEAEHCSHITAAQTQLKDREKAVDMMRQIIKHQGVLIDEGLMKPTALKPTLEGLKKAEDALAETTKRRGVEDLWWLCVVRLKTAMFKSVRSGYPNGNEYNYPCKW
ncbi:hypothetical protein CDAR_303591 [Caerostris darwini]|uniref:Uncharacterized protein n=1 Tax=Caerostris darwini TaxID=1538125 RepID=A0AAV4PMP4_9ARAC|nr:hypothetical protein CDAR_303591 [Caerostris darwini]